MRWKNAFRMAASHRESGMLLISGLSGAGKSTVLHALEDQGFFCTDNLPLEMIHDWAE